MLRFPARTRKARKRYLQTYRNSNFNLNKKPAKIYLDYFIKINIFAGSFRDVAQPGSVLAWGARGRWFESSHPD